MGYQPMDKVDAEAIMEEILGMQCGLNPNQQADANEEAEMIIRAIMQDEVDKSVYSKMADDLESAAKRMKKRKVKKVKEKGIPKFWLHALKNANEEALLGLIEP